MKNERTNWSSPKTNIFAGMNDLRKALASGCRAHLIKEWNTNCEFPIIQKTKNATEDINNWKSSSETLWSLQEIQEDKHLSDDQKYMMINYVQVFGTDQARDHYYETGKLTRENMLGVGRAHYVKRQDMIKYLEKRGEYERAACFDLESGCRRFVCNFHLKPEAARTPRKFKRKLWVVELLKDDQPKPKTPLLVYIISALVYPTKWIPKKNVLKMRDYTNITFRWGDVINGFAIEFHIPKKFSF